MTNSRIRVLIVDDSALMRQLLTKILASDPDIEVIGTAPDAYLAFDKIRMLRPDVVTLDVEMPGMDGLTFLEKLMPAIPTPVVMVSSLTQQGCEVTLRAMELGAIDFFPKPALNTATGVMQGADQIIEKVKAAAIARVVRRAPVTPSAARASYLPTAVKRFRTAPQVLLIGASTGGTEAIREVLTALPEDTPGLVIVQHIPPGFTASFAQRLDSRCALRVKEAADGDRVLPGHALIAPGDLHTSLQRSGSDYIVRVRPGEPVNRHRPSVDVLFDSAAVCAGKNAIAAILTGMGSDGASGLRRLRDVGARTIAQDEATCVIFGMPKEAIARGGAEFVLPLSHIAAEMLRLTS